ncbi:beta-lactamase family protein [Rhodobacteraceae bacterium]|nr:beta-lactamase family protein [Paracoccaceae bacterium]
MPKFSPLNDVAKLDNWRTTPYSKWSFHHVREIVPSAEIKNNNQVIVPLSENIKTFANLKISKIMDETETDAIVITKDNDILFEKYNNKMTKSSPHILFSVSKSILGLLVGSLVESKELKEDDLVIKYIPELDGTAYSDATIRDLLDMRVGVKFDEDYTAVSGPIVNYRYAANWNPVPEGVEAGDLRSFMSSLTERDGKHGGRFHYVSPNTDLMAWVCERATGVRYAELLSERLWTPIGAEYSGYITVDRIGAARAAGGVCFTARDLARVGLLIANNGYANGKKIISEAWIDDIVNNGSDDAWKKREGMDGFGNMPMHYRSFWYVQKDGDPLVHGLGIHGQYLFIDPKLNLSISWFSSDNEATGSNYISKVMNAVKLIRNELK